MVTLSIRRVAVKTEIIVPNDLIKRALGHKEKDTVQKLGRGPEGCEQTRVCRTQTSSVIIKHILSYCPSQTLFANLHGDINVDGIRCK